MLDSYELTQPIIYKILKKSLLNNKLSHAYLFESNGSDEAFDMAIAFAKSILCPYKYMNDNNCVKCTQCKKIDQSQFSELLIIEPDGLWIKKEQTDYIQHLFETKSIESTHRVYIIRHAERMNLSASNSILKFLEEPEEGIIAILIADNKYQLLDTICSRCQIISFNACNKQLSSSLSIIRKNIASTCIDNMSDQELTEKYKCVLKFVNYYEEYGKEILLHMDKLFHNMFNSRDLVLFALNIMVLYYHDVIAILCDSSNIIFHEELLDIQNIQKKNKLNTLMYKIRTIIDSEKFVAYNVNTNLFMDKLILDLEKGEYYETNCWSG